MFLKHYAGCSDNKLIGQLNDNINYQFFCDIFIPPNQRIENYKIVSEIRCQLSKNMDIDGLQKALAKHWRSYCTNKNSMVMDATCYESYLRYPTDVKLLWESVSNQSLRADGQVNLPVLKYIERRATIRQVLQQQQDKFYKDINPKDRIVSIDKPYLRPIIRGKEIKKVEFGAKLYKFQIDQFLLMYSALMLLMRAFVYNKALKKQKH